MTLSKKHEDVIFNIEEIRSCHNQILRIRPPELTPTDQFANEQDITGMGLTLNETASPISFHFYDYINIETFCWRRGDETLDLEVYASLLEEKAHIDLTACFINSQTQQCITTLALQSTTMTDKFSSINAIAVREHFADTDMDALSVIIDCQITDLLGRTTHLQMMADLTIKQPPANDDIDELAPVYTHIYPKKEDATVIFGSDPGYRLPVTYQHDMDNIVISLRRVPQQSGDSDYVCNYDSAHGMTQYYPILAMPAKGIIRLGRSVKINSVVNRKALLEKISSGGVAPITATGFLPEEIDNGSLQYALNTDWGIRLEQKGDLTPQTYHFTLSFEVNYQLPAGKEQTLNFEVSSKLHERVRTGEVIKEPILPLKIMWGCVSADTLITMDDGKKKIVRLIRCGEKVLSGLNREVTTVTNVWMGPEENLYSIYTQSGKKLKASATHPLYVDTTAEIILKHASDIRVGDLVMLFKEGRVEHDVVLSVKTIPYNDLVYNLSLENNNSFYANDFLVGDIDEQTRERRFQR